MEVSPKTLYLTGDCTVKGDLPEVSCQLMPVQGCKSGSVTTGFICLLAVLGTELGFPEAKPVGYTHRTPFLGFKGHFRYRSTESWKDGHEAEAVPGSQRHW